MVYLSKSKYCGLWQCPKIAWLTKYKPEERTIDNSVQARMDTGNDIGDLAMGLFGDYVEVTAYDGEKLNLQKMIENTKAEIEKETSVICEASFEYNGLYCAVDLMKKDGDGWLIYEVKSSSSHSEDDNKKAVYIADISYQKYVLENCGVKVNGAYLVCINGDYVFDGTLNIHKLFRIVDVNDEVDAEIVNVPANIELAEKILSSNEEPDIDISMKCNDPYGCAFWGYCTRNLPSPSVFNLYRLGFDKKLDCYYNGKISYEDLLNDSVSGNAIRKRQIDFALNDRGTFVDKEKIRNFLKSLSYPIYFLDFETEQPVVPKYVGTTPYSQVPFQYSLHYIETEGGELKHKEFLAVSGEDPRRALAERLCEDIPMNVCTTAYNKKFECGRINELAKMYPDLSEHLLNISDNIVDLLVPFQSGYYYNRAMGGSFSIKSVLPAIFPDDPSLDYHNLEGVHNGGEAMTIFPQIQFMSSEEQAEARRNLLKYCELDTYAMVKVWQELVRAANE